jgi:ATP-dependent DNA ligase
VAALLGSKRYRADLRFVVFDVPILLGADLRGLPWHERRERLELLARAFDVPLELSSLVEPSVALVEQMIQGRLEGIVLKDRTSPYRDGSRAGWTKSKTALGTSARPGASTVDNWEGLGPSPI